jgi:hypothetical protein
MKQLFLTLFVFLNASYVFAFQPSLSEQGFCADRKNELFVKDLVTNPLNLTSFQNQGGIFNKGVCWWHSRFQRNALYLTIFKPQLPKPTEDEAQSIIWAIRKAEGVVIIPGYAYFSQFSDDYADLIQRELEKWQKADGIIHFAWVKGLAGKSKAKAAKLKERMDELYEEVEGRNTIAFNKLQVPGVTAHAWLVIHMKKEIDGYLLEVLDSNFPKQTMIYKYTEGDRHFNYFEVNHFTPYLEKTDEMRKIKKVISRFCDS